MLNDEEPIEIDPSAIAWTTLEPCRPEYLIEMDHWISENSFDDRAPEILVQRAERMSVAILDRHQVPDPATAAFIVGRPSDDEIDRIRFNSDVYLAREAIGRLPGNVGNALDYLANHMLIEDPESEKIHRYLDLLSHRFTSTMRRDDLMHIGRHGLCLHGWIDVQEIRDLAARLKSCPWSVNAEEPLVEGVHTISRHLLTHLNAALRQNCGLWMRSHS